MAIDFWERFKSFLNGCLELFTQLIGAMVDVMWASGQIFAGFAEALGELIAAIFEGLN